MTLLNKRYSIRIAHAAVLMIVAVLLSHLMLTSCEYSDSDKAEKCAKAFAQDYFNLRYKHALTYCAPESEKWIRFRASNITSDDLAVLDAQSDSAISEINSSTINGNKAIVNMSVSNFLKCDSIGKPGYMCNEGHFEIFLKKEGEDWRVVMNSPL